MVIKRNFEGERSMDLYSRLLDERIVMVTEPIDDTMASIIVGQLLYLQSEDSTKDIIMYINTPGGSITSMWSIIDTMNLIKPDVATICVGLAASAGSVILASGAKGKRSILPHAEVMIHQPLGGAQGQASDIEITARHIIKTKNLLIEYMAEMTGKDKDKVHNDMDRDFFMSAEDALDYGIVDTIVETKQSVKK
jgi:ATP-dependent Clp protease protease subunit